VAKTTSGFNSNCTISQYPICTWFAARKSIFTI